MDNYTDEEIRTLYRDAKDKNRMAKKILPELTLKSEEELREIILDTGEGAEMRKPRTLITEEMTAQMIDLWRGGMRITEIADKYGIARSAVERRIYPIKAAEKAETAVRNEEKSHTEAQKAEVKQEKRMKQARRYYCELCGARYETTEEAQVCANTHVDLSEWEAEQVYGKDKDVPLKIVFKIDGTPITYFHETMC